MKTKRIYNNLSIARKMIIPYVLITVICITVLTCIISFKSAKTIMEISQHNAGQMMQSTYKSMKLQIDDINIMFTTLQANHNIQDALKDTNTAHASYNVSAVEDILAETDIYSTKTSNIRLYAINHPEYSSLSSKIVFSDNVIKNNYFYNEILANGSIPKWIANDNNYSSKSCITAVKLLTDNFTGNPLAIVQIDIDTTQFVAPLQNLHLADTGRIFVCTNSLHLLNPYKDSFIEQFAHSSDLYELIESNKVNTVYTSINNDKYMVMSYPLNGTEFHLVGALKMNELFTKSIPLRNAVIITSILLILITSLLIYYISSHISKPIVYLANEMDRYTLGNTPYMLTYNQNDEIAQLYNSFNNMQERIYNLTHDLAESLQIQKKAELKAIHSQISPHFLYNTLNSISALARKHSLDDIEYMTSSLATFFTRTLNNGNTFCTIRDELAHITSYMNIQNIRFSNKFKIDIKIPMEIMDYQIINLTLQPLVENCIVHAFSGKHGQGNILISGRKSDDDIYIDVADDGLGENITDIRYLNKRVNEPFDFDNQIDHYGIHSVHNRIQLYYGSGYGLSYSYNEMGGITATIHIPANKKEDNR